MGTAGEKNLAAFVL